MFIQWVDITVCVLLDGTEQIVKKVRLRPNNDIHLFIKALILCVGVGVWCGCMGCGCECGCVCGVCGGECVCVCRALYVGGWDMFRGARPGCGV